MPFANHLWLDCSTITAGWALTELMVDKVGVDVGVVPAGRLACMCFLLGFGAGDFAFRFCPLVRVVLWMGIGGAGAAVETPEEFNAGEPFLAAGGEGAGDGVAKVLIERPRRVGD